MAVSWQFPMSVDMADWPRTAAHLRPGGSAVASRAEPVPRLRDHGEQGLAPGKASRGSVSLLAWGAGPFGLGGVALLLEPDDGFIQQHCGLGGQGAARPPRGVTASTADFSRTKIKAARCARRGPAPALGRCLRRPGRRALVQPLNRRRSIGLPTHIRVLDAAVFLGGPLSSSRSPRLGRSLRSRRMRSASPNPRPAGHSQGISAYRGRTEKLVVRPPTADHHWCRGGRWYTRE
jgi:hypothetical protein